MIAAEVELAATDAVTSTPGTELAAAQTAPTPPKVIPASGMATSNESSAKEGMNAANWIVLSALIGLGVAAAGFSIYKKTV